MSKQNATNLAGGQRRAQFVTGNNDINAPVELKNLSSEPRTEIEVTPADRTRTLKRLTPKGDQILVQRRAAENISAGGLVIPDEAQAKDKPAEGTVMAIGPKVDDVRVGDHILFGIYAGTEYPWGVETLLFMREEEIIATVEE